MGEKEEVIAMLKYFWEEYGDIEKSTYFDEAKSSSDKDLLAIVFAWENYIKSRKIVDQLIKGL